ncbi:MAG: cupin domain-containing protein [Ilumatobacter sp.]
MGDRPTLTDDAAAIVAELDMQPHPEGGWFVETFRDGGAGPNPPHSTAIYYLLARGERSHWHRVRNAAEVWHHYAGDPLRLSRSTDGSSVEHLVLGPHITDGQRPQTVVPAGHWQAAEPLGDWTLVGCTVAPGFDFAAFDLAPPDWQPGESLVD